MRALSGRKPTLEALRADEPIEKIYLQAGVGGGSINEIVKLAKEKRIPLANLPPKQFNELTRHPNPQGVVAKLRDFEYADFDELVERSLRGAGLLLLMDEVQDTRNLGAMIRTAEATGCDGVAITKHRSAPLNETAAKTSAGAIAHLPVAQVVNLGEAIRRLKEAGFWIVGAAVENARDYREIDYRDKIALVVG
ncbi:MAG: 23S rRNA (guanosine(2251)-2'-O)-methyltransferase RlmB, partial [Ignavibacteriales bacterium]|nr:23S rRNA (guanosine(2251)-2'-O)-methyltransferase RlmB [Ignavibacteriales bacterium]